jgi:oxygen-dependent protoporphyrinogen oxidase
MNNGPDVAIIGAGITGLTTALRLREKGAAVTVFEAQDSAGGRIGTTTQDGYRLERGPHTLLERNLDVTDLVEDLGLESELVEANSEANTRFIVRDGHLHPLPMSPRDFLETDLWSRDAKLRLLLEPFIPRGPEHIDESLANFISRRLGEEILDYAVNPFVGGIYAGRPEHLSARHSFERLYRMERDHGSLFAGMISRGVAGLFDDSPTADKRLFSFHDGAARIIDRLTDRLDDDLQFSTRVHGIHGSEEGWSLDADDEAGDEFDRVVWSAPAFELPETTIDDTRGAAEGLEMFDEITYAPVAVVAFGVDEHRIDHPLDGFGFLVPEREPYDVLGTLFMSTLFPNRAPAGRALLSTFVGGARAPELLDHSDEELVQLVADDLRELIGLRADPELVDVYRWQRAIPQYEVGYGRILDQFDELERRFDGLHFTGNYRDGIAVPDLIEAANETADRVLQRT